MPLIATDVLACAAGAAPARLAVTLGDEKMTFGDVAAQANRFANSLLAFGGRPGERLAWWSDISLDGVGLYFAANRIGLAFAPLNPDYTDAEAGAVPVSYTHLDVYKRQPFAKRPTFRALSHLPLPALAQRLRDPDVRATILAEENLPGNPSVVWDEVPGNLPGLLHRVYPMGVIPDYEPLPERSVVNLARAAGVAPVELFYDLMLEDEGRAMLLLPIYNYAWENHDAIREMLTHPQSVSGLSDGGAHCGMICDASIPTYLLTHWARDRVRGERLPLEWVVKKQTRDTATLYGLGDRGVLEAGLRADINVIDFDNLRLDSPTMVHDLPAGGRRLLQQAEGYDYTVVAGQ